MSVITYTNTFTAGDSLLGSKIMQNFNDVTTVLNGLLEETNLKTNTSMSINTITASTKIRTSKINTPTMEDMTIAIPTSGDTKLIVRNSNDVVIFEIDNNGDLII